MLYQSNLITQRCQLIFWVECSVGRYLVLAKEYTRMYARGLLILSYWKTF
jgi:hypothetical protein